VLIADNKELFREGLVKLLESQPHIQVVCHCNNDSKAIEKARETTPDVVVMDVQMADCDGIETAQCINKELPDTKVAILTDSEDEEELFSALKVGVRGYLLKNIDIDCLVKSIHLIAEGEIIISPPLAERLIYEFTSLKEDKQARDAEEPLLSDREIEVIKLVASGATNREIAASLIIAENTVKVHIKNILEKLHLRNKQQAAAYAVQQGLVLETGDKGEETD